MRKFLAMMLSFIICASTVTTVVNAAKFTDVPATNETLTKAVDLLSSVGITTGTTPTTYGTSEGVTRQQMATFIYRLMKAGKTVAGKEGDNSTTFTDLDDPFYYFMISWANDTGIIKGRNETTFDPKGGIILQDAYVMLVRALGYEKKEALAYPFGYIKVAEDIGLDEGLPSNVNYGTALTRGNVAILLYNAFYAEMAPTKVTVAPNMEMDAESTTVAESIFAIDRTVQRVVATPNYSLDSVTTAGEDNMVELKCLDLELSKKGHDGLFGSVEFDSLGLEGTADDYFLIDLAIYYKTNNSGEPEIVAATPLGSRTEGIPGSKIKFETDKNYGYQSDGNSKAHTGKVTIDGQVSYLFDAPSSYSEYENDEECITLLFLGESDRDPEDEDYVPDFNFKADLDAFGRGQAEYQHATPYVWKNTAGNWVRMTTPLGQSDPRGIGMYSMGGAMYIMGIQLSSSTKFEADIWDSNGDGKVDYMWPKPYTVGVVVEDEGEPFMSNHEEGQDRFSCIIEEAGELPVIYTYGANKEGVDFKNGQLFEGYVNGPANYIKCKGASDIEYKPNQVFDTRRDGITFGFNGTSTNRANGSRDYIGLPNASGVRSGIVSIGSGYPWYAPYSNTLFDVKNFGNTYKILYLGTFVFHAIATSGVFEGNEDYAIIFPNTDNRYAYTASVGVVEDGNLAKAGNMIEALIDGELVNVLVQPQTSSSTASKNAVIVDGKTVSLMPVTPKQANDVYDFSDYAGKLLTYTVNYKGEYIFKIAPLSASADKEVLSGDDPDAYYTFEAESTPEVTYEITSAFVNTTNNLYQFFKTETDTVNTQVYPGRYLSFTENTKVVIKTIDSDDQVEFKMYDVRNMPNFSKDDELANIKYVVRNNPKSKTTEELIYLYAEASNGDTTIKTSKTLDYRFVTGSKIVKGEEGTVIYYDVYNPFTGKIEEEYEVISGSATADCTINGIYSLTGGYINDKNLLGVIDNLGEAATSDTTYRTRDLGLVKIGDYDDESGFLTIENEDIIFQVDEDTAISFIDLDNKTIEPKKTSILSSASATYRCNDNKKMPMLAFVASSEIKNEDEIEHAEVICIVRYNSLDEGNE